MAHTQPRSRPVADYEEIGRDYSHARRTDPRIAERIFQALGDASSVLNVGAGTGSYEPPDRDVLAVEPSLVMRSQRPPNAAPCIDARAEALPFPDKSFDAALAVLADHHWRDPIAGLQEMRRIARRVVVFQWDDAEIERFWLVRDYLLPEYRALAVGRPTLRERARAIEACMEPVPIPFDVVDGFLSRLLASAFRVPAGARSPGKLCLGTRRRGHGATSGHGASKRSRQRRVGESQC